MIKLNAVRYNLAVGERALLYTYPSGDVDRLPWPLEARFRSAEELELQLREALLDAVETGELPSGTRAVQLPDGTEFAL